MQYFTGSFFHQYPFLEYRGFRFTDNDTFRNRQSEVDRQAAAEPKVNILNGFPGDNELAVGTKKCFSSSWSPKAQSAVYRMQLAVGSISSNLFIHCIKIQDIFYLQRIKFVGEHDQKALYDVPSLYGIVRAPDMGHRSSGLKRRNFPNARSREVSVIGFSR